MGSMEKLIDDLFRNYYKRAKIFVPQLEKREFGIGYKKKIERRHLSFFTEEELRKFLIEETPRYISYSIAYYEKPSAEMKNKGWSGADLVFDLDAEEGSLDSLMKVKEQAAQLYDILKEEFGAKKVLKVFSGNKGFHIHVYDEAFRDLGSEERRRIVEYVSGKNFDYTRLFYKNESGTLLGPKPTEKGYRGRFARKAIELARERKSPIYAFGSETERELFIKGVQEGIWSKIRAREPLKRFSVITDYLGIKAIDVDGAVTYDIKRLIRMPNSLHGSTGFRVLPIKDIDAFEIEKAIAFSDEPIKFKANERIEGIELLSWKEEIKKGEIKRIPLYVAVFLELKGKGEIIF
jgi:DNA primase small subunit